MVSDTANTTRMTGAEAIVASLEALGVTLSDTPAFPAGAAIAGVAISTSIGALCGIIPALAAVRIKPIDAIRY